MLKRKFIIIFISCVAIFFFYNTFKISASGVAIIETPTASDIVYGEPLFQSKLDGGEANVEGTFYWKNELQTFDAGEYDVKVVFTPTDETYQSVEILVHLKVNKRRVYVKFEKDIYKHYDGTSVIDLPNYIVGGIIDKEVHVSGKLEGKLESVLIGETEVILNGLTLEGDIKENYYLDLEGNYACVHPRYIEKFGLVKHRIDFGPNTYVPVDSLIYVDELTSTELYKKGYKIKTVYDVYLKSGNTRVKVGEGSKVRIKIEKDKFDYRRLEIYNYYDGVYEKLDYVYKDGYIEYTTSQGLGKLVFTQRKISFLWLYIIGAFAVSVAVGAALFSKRDNHKEKINKYKSLKRGKDNGDY